MRLILALALLLVALASCARKVEIETPVFHAEGYPERLSDWKLLSIADGRLRLNQGVHPYDLATPLFSDYALKLRTLTLPKGQSATYNAEEAFDFPDGTIISKTFFYPQSGETWSGAVVAGADHTVSNGEITLEGYRLIETRLLVRRAGEWVAIPYVWNDDQTDAVLKRTGDIVPMTLMRDGRETHFSYVVPNQNQCAGCHATNNTTRALAPIGLKARHLNKPSSFDDGLNQLSYWVSSGLLSGAPASLAGNGEASSQHAEGAASIVIPRNASWTEQVDSLDARARSYLDINCSHCHSDKGPADTSGLDLRPTIAMGPKYGACKTPVAAGGGSGGRPYDIVPGDPDRSIFVYRMETTRPGEMMPELGRTLAHEEGVALVAAWIASLSGSCR